VESFFKDVLAHLEAGHACAMATVVQQTGSSPRDVGAKLLADEHGNLLSGTVGGGLVEAQTLKACADVLCSGSARILDIDLSNTLAAQSGMICGGSMRIFVEPLLPPWRMVLIGGGHVSLATASIAEKAGFDITVIEDREEFATPERFPNARRYIIPEYENCFAEIKPNRNTCLVIVTRGHMYDSVVLRQALSTKAGYIGMIGSRRKRAEIYAALLEQGIAQEQLDKVHSPISLPIHAETPEEIAVSIVAECIQHRRTPQEVLV